MTKTMVCALAVGASVIVTTGFAAIATPLAPEAALSSRPKIVSIQFRPREDRLGPVGPRFHPRPVPRPRVIHRTVQPRHTVVKKRPVPLCRCR